MAVPATLSRASTVIRRPMEKPPTNANLTFASVEHPEQAYDNTENISSKLSPDILLPTSSASFMFPMLSVHYPWGMKTIVPAVSCGRDCMLCTLHER